MLNHEFGVAAFTSITSCHHLSMTISLTVGKDVSLLMDQSEHMCDRIICVKCESKNYFFISQIFVVAVLVVLIVCFLCLLLLVFLFANYFILLFSFFIFLFCLTANLGL